MVREPAISPDNTAFDVDTGSIVMNYEPCSILFVMKSGDSLRTAELLLRVRAEK